MNSAKGSCVLLAIGALAGAGAVTAAGWAQGSGQVQRTVLLTKPMAAQGYEGVVVRGEIPPGAGAPKHFHHGDELVVLLEGEVEVELEGAPTHRVKAGEAMHVEAGRVHRPKSVGAVPAKYVAVWIVERGKPLSVNAP